jgi:hypothetical protein
MSSPLRSLNCGRIPLTSVVLALPLCQQHCYRICLSPRKRIKLHTKKSTTLNKFRNLFLCSKWLILFLICHCSSGSNKRFLCSPKRLDWFLGSQILPSSGYMVIFLHGKWVEGWKFALSSIQSQRQEWVELTSSPSLPS